MIMRAKKQRKDTSIWIGAAILCVGILIGALADPASWIRASVKQTAGRNPEPNAELHPNLVRSMLPPRQVDNGLDTLYLIIDSEAAQRIQKVHDRAMERGLIVQGPDDVVPAKVRLGENTVQAEIRLKGDWTDHVETDKWSYRVKLKDDKLMGMSVFSIQRPKTRGFMWEWLLHEAMRREGVLAPRSTFVNVVINNNRTGIYFLEEHFSKEMLESQGRREGSIVRFDESSMWATKLQAHHLERVGIALKPPTTSSSAWLVDRANISAYGERRLSSIEPLSRALHSAIEKMRALQNLAVSSRASTDRLVSLQALSDLRGQTVDRLFDTDRLACAHALLSLFRVHHSLIWHNVRFYYDPVQDRLEPISFDNSPDEASSGEPAIFSTRTIMKEFAKSNSYYARFFVYLGRFSGPEYFDGLIRDLWPDLQRFEEALNAEQALPSWYRLGSIVQRLRAQQLRLKPEIYPADPINFSSYVKFDGKAGVVRGTLEVRARSATRTPVALEGFRFSNGSKVPARRCLVENQIAVVSAGEGSVVLPPDGREIVFRFPMNQRLANLENVAQIKQAVRVATSRKSPRLDVVALFRPIAADEIQEEMLVFRKFEPRWSAEGGRPDLPRLADALERYRFLVHDIEHDTLRIKTGTWDVRGDLLVPSGYTLRAGSNVTLRFREHAVLLTDSPLVFSGTKAQPVILEPAEGASSWDGVVVLKAQGRSEWTHVIVRKTDSVSRAGWVLTGGITFYHSPLTIRDSHIDGTLAEDGMNVFGADLLFERVKFSGSASDSFDGDFITGTIRDSVFEDGVADGVDFSGSDVTLERCEFINLGDKAISAGEDSTVRVIGGLIDRTSIGIASKDFSRVVVAGTDIREVKNYAFAVYIKKAEYGPSQVTARNVKLGRFGLGESLVQTNCKLILNGKTIKTRDLDVDRLYEDKILGN